MIRTLPRLVPIVCVFLFALPDLFLGQNSVVRPDHVLHEGFGICKPVTERDTELGCWILTEQPVGRMTESQIYWHLNEYPSEAAANSANTGKGTVVKSLGRYWLLSLEKAGWMPTQKGKHVADIGPIAVDAGKDYSALYMEAIMTPGMASSVHVHSGPEVWYTEAGQTCLETPQGKLVGTPGKSVIVPAGSLMHLTATGKTQRRAIVLILHESGKPPTTVIHDWKPKGLCRQDVNQ